MKSRRGRIGRDTYRLSIDWQSTNEKDLILSNLVRARVGETCARKLWPDNVCQITHDLVHLVTDALPCPSPPPRNLGQKVRAIIIGSYENKVERILSFLFSEGRGSSLAYIREPSIKRKCECVCGEKLYVRGKADMYVSKN